MTRDTWLPSLCAVRASVTLIFMTYAACLPVLRVAWDMSATAAGSIPTGFHLGNGLSLLIFSWLADRIGARRVFLASAAGSAVTALAFAMLARSYLSGLVLLTLVALTQGGMYSTGIMLVAERYGPRQRGAAMGWLIASSSVGYTASLLLSGAMLARGGYPLAFLATACGPVAGAAIAWLALRSTPNVIHPRREGLRFGTAVLRNRGAMRVILGYMAHNWELIGMTTWAPAFVAAALTVGAMSAGAAQRGAYVAAAFHAMAFLASLSMGRLSDRLGRRAVLLSIAATSAACSLIFGWLIRSPTPVIVAVGALYGFTALGDSAVLSTALTETVDPAYLGSALALRSVLSSGAGALAPLAFGAVLDATNPPGGTPATWGWAFTALGAGALIATLCAYGLRERHAR